MTKRVFHTTRLLAVIAALCFSSVLLAQGRRDEAFARVRQVQLRHMARLMAIKGIEGVAIGLNQNDQPALHIFTARPGVPGIPNALDGVPVRVMVTGKFYALKPPTDRPPKPPRGLTATAASDEIRINLDWRDNRESDLSHYNVYRSTTQGGPYTQIEINPALEISEYSDDDPLLMSSDDSPMDSSE